MGFSWSLFFAQDVDTHQLAAATGATASSLLHDRAPPAILRPPQTSHRTDDDLDEDDVYMYIYVDNTGIICIKHSIVVSLLHT